MVDELELLFFILSATSFLSPLSHWHALEAQSPLE
nr:MAG TPA: hypothetical protein [Bacteriophage sp.]